MRNRLILYSFHFTMSCQCLTLVETKGKPDDKGTMQCSLQASRRYRKKYKGQVWSTGRTLSRTGIKTYTNLIK